MEGPTPVSALIHAATMVTAGVFLMVRFSNFFFFASEVKPFIIFIGTLTTFFAATVALVQNDIKKIIAYSTCSQLGYMVTACGFDLYGFAFFHLAMHAFFKALLFLCAGSVIHALSDEQDIRKMGGLALKLPVTFFCMLIASLSLAGFPFLSGFYSKESILETVLSIGTSDAFFAYFFGIFSVFLTSFYSFRLLFLVFFGKPNGNTFSYKNIHATSLYILIPLVVLSFLSIFLGYSSFNFFLNLNLNLNFVSFMSFNFFLKILPVVLLVFSFSFAYFLYLSSFRKNFMFVLNYPFFFSIYSFLNKKWYVDTFYNFFLSRFSFLFSYFYNYTLFEKG
jgi:NADH:ubiquinone oxidoreductase subunit 5 (subunit L)/multisubunit Na+/H+ antiporter MnhA subunit